LGRPTEQRQPQLQQCKRRELQPAEHQQGEQLGLTAEEQAAEQGISRRRQLILNLENEVRSMPFALKKDDEFPLGGRLRFFASFWQKLTNSREIMSLILGVLIPFTSEPHQSQVPKSLKCRVHLGTTGVAQKIRFASVW
jgi:hypothetical protein